MKTKLFIYAFALLSVFAVYSCGNKEAAHEETVAAIDSSKVPAELTDITGVSSYYECPMKCEGKKFAAGGICPVCGMDLVIVQAKADTTVAAPDTTHAM